MNKKKTETKPKMAEKTTTSSPEIFEQNPIDDFLKKVEPYSEKITRTATHVIIALKPSVLTDKAQLRELINISQPFHATLTKVPLGLIIPIIKVGNGETYALYLPTDEGNDYSLAASKAGLGELYPVLKDAHGNIIDGFHRKGECQDWHEITVPQIDTPLKLELARLVANYVRRKVKPEEIKERLRYLINEGLTVEDIIRLTGIAKSTIYHYMPDDLKNSVKVKAGQISGKVRQSRNSVPTLEQTVTTQETSTLPTIEGNLSQRKVKALAKEVSAIPGVDVSTVQEAVDLVFSEADDAVKKEKRIFERLVKDTKASAPVELMREVRTRFSIAKITQLGLDDYLSTVFECMFDLVKQEGKLDKVFDEANKRHCDVKTGVS